METIAYNFHDNTGEIFNSIQLKAGDDAKCVKWMDIEGSSMKLYASHLSFIEKVVKIHDAYWP
jgi:ADP-ribose pyrophosphatase